MAPHEPPQTFGLRLVAVPALVCSLALAVLARVSLVPVRRFRDRIRARLGAHALVGSTLGVSRALIVEHHIVRLVPESFFWIGKELPQPPGLSRPRTANPQLAPFSEAISCERCDLLMHVSAAVEAGSRSCIVNGKLDRSTRVPWQAEGTARMDATFLMSGHAYSRSRSSAAARRRQAGAVRANARNLARAKLSTRETWLTQELRVRILGAWQGPHCHSV